MKIVLKNQYIGTQITLRNKEELIEFAKKKIGNCFFANHEQEELKWKLLEDKNVNINEICNLLNGTYKRIN